MDIGNKNGGCSAPVAVTGGGGGGGETLMRGGTGGVKAGRGGSGSVTEERAAAVGGGANDSAKFGTLVRNIWFDFTQSFYFDYETETSGSADRNATRASSA